jgi:gliding-associated putative ABC transporter substrate-binding component GldG
MVGVKIQMKRNISNTGLQAFLYFLVVILANVVVSGWFFRIDMTKDKVNTLSPATASLLKSLKDRMIVRVYFNSDLPSPYSNNRRALIDILQELRSLSNGKLEYEIYDPTSDSDISKATSDGIPQVQVQVVNNDKMEVKRAFMGMVIEYQARKQIIPVIEDLSNFEYEIASRIDRLIHPNKKTIAIAQGNGEPSFEDMQKAEQALSTRYSLLPVNFSEPVPDSVEALIMIQPTTTFSDSQLYYLDQYMMKRGRAAFLTSMVNASMQSQFATNLNLNLSRLFHSYGFEIKKNIVRDAVCASVTMMQRESGFTIQTELPNPYIPIINNLNKSFVVTQNLHQIIMPFPSEIDTTSAHELRLNVVPFALSSQRSGIQTGFYDLDPSAQFTRAMFQEHYLLLGAAISGKIKTAIPDTDRYAKIDSNRKTEGIERIVVMGSGNFVRDIFLNDPENLSILLNTVDYLTDDIGLVSIRSKSFLPEPLKPVSEGTRTATKYAITGFPPLIMLTVGLIYWRKTVKRRQSYHASLGGEIKSANTQQKA